tara:strand:- start:53 stop:349 length:297 start_codon:yes stop_codon:yes gene_type:complete
MKYYITQQGRDLLNEVSAEHSKAVAAKVVGRAAHNVFRAKRGKGNPPLTADEKASSGKVPSQRVHRDKVQRAEQHLARKQDQAERIADTQASRKAFLK